MASSTDLEPRSNLCFHVQIIGPGSASQQWSRDWVRSNRIRTPRQGLSSCFFSTHYFFPLRNASYPGFHTCSHCFPPSTLSKKAFWSAVLSVVKFTVASHRYSYWCMLSEWVSRLGHVKATVQVTLTLQWSFSHVLENNYLCFPIGFTDLPVGK